MLGSWPLALTLALAGLSLCPDQSHSVDFTRAIPPGPPLTFLERLRETFAQLADVIPAMIGALIILFAGYLLAKLIEQGAERLLHRIRLNQALERGGVMEAVERGASHFNPTKVVGKTLFWIMMFAVIMVAATALGLESLAGVFTELVGYLPSLMSAIVIMIVGIVLGPIHRWA